MWLTQKADRLDRPMKIAHIRERHAPAGTPWRLAAALDDDGTRWLDLEAARRRLVGADPSLAHNSSLFRQPVTTLDDHLARGLRVEGLADLLRGDAEEPVEVAGIVFGPPILRPPSLRDFYQRLIAAGKAKELALTAAMRKLLVILNAILRDRQPWRAPQPA